MSLIVAAYNDTDIVIGWDSLSTYRKDGAAYTPDEEAVKVRQINDSLAFMITGAYMSDKVQFMKDFASSTEAVVDLGTAFERLSAMAQTAMTMHRGEAFGIGLAGYHEGAPGFQRIERVYGDPINDRADYPLNMNCYLNGIEEAYQLVADRLTEKDIFTKPATPIIEAAIRGIIEECIGKYERLGPPAMLLTLSG